VPRFTFRAFFSHLSDIENFRIRVDWGLRGSAPLVKTKVMNDATRCDSCNRQIVDPGFGKPYGYGYITADGTHVTMWRKGQKVRFFTDAGIEVGVEQSNVAPAAAYAHSVGWYHDDWDVSKARVAARKRRETIARKKAALALKVR
jgi:hypothetical protein